MKSGVRIGVDIGGVLKDKTPNIKTLEEYLSIRPKPGALEAVGQFVESFGSKNVFVISRCPKEYEETSLRWLSRHGFFDQAGLLRNNVYFCRERIDKARIAKKLKLTHFIDDREDVLDAMRGTVEFRILFNSGTVSGGYMSIGAWSTIKSTLLDNLT